MSSAFHGPLGCTCFSICKGQAGISSYKWGFLLWVKVLGAKVAKIKKREKESTPIKMAYY